MAISNIIQFPLKHKLTQTILQSVGNVESPVGNQFRVRDTRLNEGIMFVVSLSSLAYFFLFFHNSILLTDIRQFALYIFFPQREKEREREISSWFLPWMISWVSLETGNTCLGQSSTILTFLACILSVSKRKELVVLKPFHLGLDWSSPTPMHMLLWRSQGA